jgi:hypothetical protein
MDTKTHGQAYFVLLLQMRIAGLHSLNNAKPSAYSSLGVVFVRPGIAEVDYIWAMYPPKCWITSAQVVW